MIRLSSWRLAAEIQSILRDYFLHDCSKRGQRIISSSQISFLRDSQAHSITCRQIKENITCRRQIDRFRRIELRK
jgi:hypothetical protein